MKKKSTRQLQLPIGNFVPLGHALDEASSAFAALIRKSKLSRDELAQRVSLLLGRSVSTDSLNAWTAPTNRNRMPADVMAALCVILKDFSPLNLLLAPAGVVIADPRDQAFCELGKTRIERETLEEREREALFIIKGGTR